jgi:fatty-acyl-CoA synthase
MRTWKGQTFGRQFEETAAGFSDKEFMIFGDRRITFGQARNEVNRLAKGLIRLGMKKGDNVAVWLPNLPEFLFVWLAASKIGAPLIPINTRYKSAEFSYILGNCEATTLFVIPEFLNMNYMEMVSSVIPELGGCEPGRLVSGKFPKLKNLICLGDARYPGAFSFDGILELGEGVGDRYLKETEDHIRPEDELVIVYTSGTTGNPKGAVHTHGILKNEIRICNWRNLDAGDKFLAFLPWFHVGGGFSQVCPSLITGASLVLMSSFDAAEAMRLIEREHITQLDGIPTHFIMIMEHPEFEKYDLSSLKGGWAGGAPVTKEVALGMIHKLGMKEMVVVYGMTETTSVTTFTKVGDSLEHITTTDGIPISTLDDIPGFEVRIVEPDTSAELPRGREGEICVRGDIVMKGYYKDPEATRKAIDPDGWFHTGDLGVMFDDGYLKLTGRVKDMFIVGGSNAYPAEIEAFLSAHPKVKMVQIVGVPERRLGEVGAAFVELKEGERSTEEEIIAFCRDRMANFKVPRHVIFLTQNQWPLTPSGKVQKYMLRKRFLAKLAAEGWPSGGTERKSDSPETEGERKG